MIDLFITLLESVVTLHKSLDDAKMLLLPTHFIGRFKKKLFSFHGVDTNLFIMLWNSRKTLHQLHIQAYCT